MILHLKKLGIFAIIFFSIKASAQTIPPEESFELPPIVAVQNKAYTVKRDLTFQAGLLPSDAFNKGFPVGISYTHYFNTYMGWEVVNANFTNNQETKLKSDINDLGIEVTNKGFGGALDFISYYATTNFVYTPIYAKNLAFNSDVVHSETSFVGGLGVANFDYSGPRLLLNLGVYFRYFTETGNSWKFDIRDLVYYEEDLGVVNSISFTVGYSLTLGEHETRQK